MAPAQSGDRAMRPQAHARTKVMGVLNVTPDSFSDGGQWFDVDAAVAHGLELLSQGADLIDIGGESTRPGAERISPAIELERILPVVEGLRTAGAPLSVDTMRAEVAARALDAGASIINDVSGGQADPAMAPLIAERGCTYILSHWRGPSKIMNTLAVYDDVVADVIAEMTAQTERVLAAGVRPEQLILDPGLGFAKDGADNWQLIAHLEDLKSIGYPILIGASRKRFLGELLQTRGSDARPINRDQATAAVTAIAAHRGVWGVRVHEVSASVDAISVAEAIRMANNG